MNKHKSSDEKLAQSGQVEAVVRPRVDAKTPDGGDAPMSYNSLQKYTTSELRQLLRLAEAFENAPARHNILLVLAER